MQGEENRGLCRTLFFDTPRFVDNGKLERKGEVEEKPSTRLDLNPRPQDHEGSYNSGQEPLSHIALLNLVAGLQTTRVTG